MRELRDTKAKLTVLVDALQQVRADPEAAKLLDAAMATTADGTGTSATDLEHMFQCCLAHAYARLELEKVRAREAQLRVVS